jgi:dimethylamine monooxygenase subunit C
MSVCMETTSVPRWHEEQHIAEGGRTVTVLSFGDAAAEHARKVLSTFPGRRVNWLRLSARWNDASADALRRRLSAARVGCRLVLVGEEAPVLSARAEAVAAGLLDDEILPITIGSESRTVYCAHCHATHLAAVGIGQVTTCPNCMVELVVYHHVSRHHGAYLGYMIDSEES